MRSPALGWLWVPLALVACTSPAPEGGPSNLPPLVPELVPVLVGALSPPPAAAGGEGVQLVGALPGAPALASPAGAGGPALVMSPSPSPSPSPSLEPPKVVEGRHFFLRALPGWRVASQSQSPDQLSLEGPGRVAFFSLKAENAAPGTLLDAKLAEWKAGVGDGLVASQNVTVDKVRGFLILANVERPEGKRFLQLRGFIYRNQLWRMESGWDKRSPEAARWEKELESMVGSFTWL